MVRAGYIRGIAERALLFLAATVQTGCKDSSSPRAATDASSPDLPLSTVGVLCETNASGRFPPAAALEAAGLVWLLDFSGHLVGIDLTHGTEYDAAGIGRVINVTRTRRDHLWALVEAKDGHAVVFDAQNRAANDHLEAAARYRRPNCSSAVSNGFLVRDRALLSEQNDEPAIVASGHVFTWTGGSPHEVSMSDDVKLEPAQLGAITNGFAYLLPKGLGPAFRVSIDSGLVESIRFADGRQLTGPFSAVDPPTIPVSSPPRLTFTMSRSVARFFVSVA